MIKKEGLNAIDLFSGAGGLHLGFKNEGYNILLSSDFDKNCEIAHTNNFPDVPFLKEDIRKINFNKIESLIGKKEVDIVLGGPPCQGFSTIGKRASSNPDKRKKNDARNYLFEEYIRLIKEINPKVFVMENVKGLLTMRDNGGLFIHKIINGFRKIGYTDIDYKLLDTVDYGVPQHRKRVIIIGNRIGRKITFPEPTHSAIKGKGKELYLTVGDVIMNIINKENLLENHVPMNHGGKNIERYKLIPEGGRMPEHKLSKELYRKNFGNTFKRLDRDKPALTMVPGHSAFPIHPTKDRSLTVREAARIQTFPDWVKFSGSRTQQGLQVGNAVPVRFAQVLAKHIKEGLLR